MLSSKNSMLSSAAADLGLGDQLKGQVESELAARKKKLLQNAGLGGAAAGGLGSAAQSLFAQPGGGFNGQ